MKNGQYRGYGGVVDSDGKYIEDSWMTYGFGGKYSFQTDKYFDTTVVYLGTDHHTWGHFLVDVVPRLWYSMHKDDEPDMYVIIRDEKDDGKLLKNEEEFFKYLGICEKIAVITTPTKYHKVIIPKRSYLPMLRDDIYGASSVHPYYLETINYVRDKVLETENDREEECEFNKVFFTRSALSENNYHESGIQAVDSLFLNNGYQLLSPEKMTLYKLIKVLSNCQEVAYLSGTLQHNMLFAPSGLKTICIERKPLLVRYQTDIDLIKKLNVTYVSGTYSLWPGNVSISGIYVLTQNLLRLADTRNFKPADRDYCEPEYLDKTINKYLGEYEKCEEWMNLDADSFLPTIVEERNELSSRVSGIRTLTLKEIHSVDNINRDIERTLIDRGIAYSRWKDSDYFSFCDTAARIIEYALNKNKRSFLLYPYGNLGMLFFLILREHYGIEPKAVFDNKLSQLRQDIFPVEHIRDFIDEDTIIILTSKKRECLEALSEHINIDNTLSPYSII